MGTYAYLAPRYFATNYFKAASPVLPRASTVVTDRLIFRRICSILDGTRRFGRILLAASDRPTPIPFHFYPLAIVQPSRWVETEDATATELIKSVHFLITLSVRHTGAIAGFEELDKLTCLAQNLLDGSDLGGIALPELTRLSRGAMRPSRGELRVVLEGVAAYVVNRVSGRDDQSQ